MSTKKRLSRREFIKLAGLLAPAAIFGACSSSAKVKDLPHQTRGRATITDPIVESLSIKPTKTIEAIINPIIPEMVIVEPGSFQMGSDQGHPNEQPIHTTNITRPFAIAIYAVTFDEYEQFSQDTNINIPDDNGWGKGSRPVFHVNSYEAMEYCNWLSEKEGLQPCYSVKGKASKCDFLANGYRLPTEAEWEYAAGGGQISQGYIYSGSNNPDEVAWYEKNSGGQTHPVGQKKPNELGIYDMSGNMWEWCWDWYDKTYYESSPGSDPRGPQSIPKVPGVTDPERVRRGGSYPENADSLRVSRRSADSSTYRGGGGFRMVRTL